MIKLELGVVKEVIIIGSLVIFGVTIGAIIQIWIQDVDEPQERPSTMEVFTEAQEDRRIDKLTDQITALRKKVIRENAACFRYERDKDGSFVVMIWDSTDKTFRDPEDWRSISVSRARSMVFYPAGVQPQEYKPLWKLSLEYQK